MSKMHGKQKVVSGFNLEAFAGGAEEEVRAVPKPKPKVQSEPRKPKKAAPVQEQLTERIQIKVTKAEMAKLKEKIGLVPVSKWLRHELKERGIL